MKSKISLFVLFLLLFNRAHSQDHSRVVSLENLSAAIVQYPNATEFIVKNGRYNNITVRLEGVTREILIKPEHSGEVVVTGTSNLLILKSSNITLSGFKFVSTKSKALINIYTSNSIMVSDNIFENCGNDPFGAIVRIREGSSNNKITRNLFDNNRSMGIVINASTQNDHMNMGNVIENNIFSNIADVQVVYGTNNGLETIQVGQTHSGIGYKLNTLIRNNHFENIIGDRKEIISIKASNNSIYDNRFYNCESGVTIRYGNDCVFSGNVMKNIKEGIRVYGNRHQIVDNMLVDCEKPIQMPSATVSSSEIMRSEGYQQASRVKVRNNIVVSYEKEAVILGENGNSRSMKYKPSNISVRGNQTYKSNRNIISTLSRMHVESISKVIKNRDLGPTWRQAHIVNFSNISHILK